MVIDEEVFARLSQSFSTAVLDPELWSPAMAELADTVGAVGCALELSDLTTGKAFMDNTAELDEGLARQYETRVFGINPRIRSALQLGLGAVADDSELIDHEDSSHGEFIDWLSRTPYYYLIGAKICEQDGAVGFLTANFSKRHGMATSEHHKVFQALTPHLINTLSASREIARGTLRGEALSLEAMEADRAFAFIAANGRIIECSTGFEALLRRQTSVMLRHGVFVSRRPEDRPALETFLAAALGPRRHLTPPRPIRLHAADSLRGLAMRAIPIPSKNNVFDIFRPAALLTLTDLDQPYRVRRGDLVDLFGLTEREAEIAALLVEGLTIERLSEALSISSYTVRQHLKSAFGKMGVSRQAELVAVVARLT